MRDTPAWFPAIQALHFPAQSRRPSVGVAHGGRYGLLLGEASSHPGLSGRDPRGKAGLPTRRRCRHRLGPGAARIRGPRRRPAHRRHVRRHSSRSTPRPFPARSRDPPEPEPAPGSTMFWSTRVGAWAGSGVAGWPNAHARLETRSRSPTRIQKGPQATSSSRPRRPTVDESRCNDAHQPGDQRNGAVCVSSSPDAPWIGLECGPPTR